MATTKAKSQTFTIVKTINYDTVYLNQYLLTTIKKDTVNCKDPNFSAVLN